MPSVTIDIRGVDDLMRRLGNIADVRAVLRPAMQHWTQRALDDMQYYPPELPGQRYIRTFVLRGGWRATVSAAPGGLTGLVRNANVPYNVRVQNERQQAGIHRGRWLTDEGWVNGNRAAVQESFRQAIQTALGGR